MKQKIVIILDPPASFGYIVNLYFNGIPNHNCIVTFFNKILDNVAGYYQGGTSELEVFKEVVEFLYEWQQLELIEGKAPLFSIKEDKNLCNFLYMLIEEFLKNVMNELVSNNLMYSTFNILDINNDQIVIREV